MSKSALFKYVLLLAVVAPLFALSGETPAVACSCAQSSVQEAYERADVVFTGTAVAVAQRYDPHEAPGTIGRRNAVLFEVDRSYKNMPQTEVIVFAGFSEASCGFDFRTGEAYLVYAYDREGGERHTSLCTRTASIEAASEDLAWLGEGEAPTDRVDLRGQLGESWWDKAMYHAKRIMKLWTYSEARLLAWIAMAAVAAAAVIGAICRQRAFLRPLASAVGIAAAAAAILLWTVLNFFNPYGAGTEADVLLMTALLLLLPALLALLSAYHRSARWLFAAFVWALPLGLYMAVAGTLVSLYAVSVFLYFVSALWLLLANKREI